jgi:osmotically-inducible protein OsmY
MQNDVRQSRRHSYSPDSYGPDSAGGHVGDRHGGASEPRGPGGVYEPSGEYEEGSSDFEPSPLFQPGQQRLNQFERSGGRSGASSASDMDSPGRSGGSARSRARTPRILPKGYTRSDERIREDICETLSRSGTDVSDVSVEVSGGKVVLEGTVIDRYAKHEIEDHAADCLGVSEVDNRIRVRR